MDFLRDKQEGDMGNQIGLGSGLVIRSVEEFIEENVLPLKENGVTLYELYERGIGRYTRNALSECIDRFLTANVLSREIIRGVSFYYSMSDEDKSVLNNKRVKKLNRENKKKFLKCYTKGFKCKYCGRRMQLDYVHPTSFVLEHNTSKFNNGSNVVGNTDIVCASCNHFKNSLNGCDFDKILYAITKTWGKAFYRHIIAHYDTHARKILEARRDTKKVSCRPKKEIDVEYVITQYGKGITLTEIAATMHVSYSTIQKRLREKGIKLESLARS